MPPAELNMPRSTAVVKALQGSSAAPLLPPAASATPGVSSGRRSVVMTGAACGGIGLHYRPRRKRRIRPPRVSWGKREVRKEGQELGFGVIEKEGERSWLFSYIYPARSLSCFGWGVFLFFFAAFSAFFFPLVVFYIVLWFMICQGSGRIESGGVEVDFSSSLSYSVWYLFCGYETVLNCTGRYFLSSFSFLFFFFYLVFPCYTDWGIAIDIIHDINSRIAQARLPALLPWTSLNFFIISHVKLTSGVFLLFFLPLSCSSIHGIPCYSISFYAHFSRTVYTYIPFLYNITLSCSSLVVCLGVCLFFYSELVIRACLLE